ncbi:MAG: protease PrsW [Thermoplasmatales archaeon]|nr:MAG: protease PrsW [Thermoplasmatales archaeon]
MNDIVLPQASLFLGIIPALILLYISLKGYEVHYKDKNIFLTFVIGIVFGFFAAIARIYTVPLVIIYIISIAIFEQLFKTIILNLRRLQEKKETTIYGLSLGLGFGAIFTPFLLISVGSSTISNLHIFLLIIIGSFGFILFHAASGAYIGYGIFAGKLTKFLALAIIVQLPFNIISDLTRLYFTTNYFAYLQVGLVLYGLIFFWYVVKKIMPRILSQSQRRKRRKKTEQT